MQQFQPTFTLWGLHGGHVLTEAGGYEPSPVCLRRTKGGVAALLPHSPITQGFYTEETLERLAFHSAKGKHLNNFSSRNMCIRMHTNTQIYTDVNRDHTQTETVFPKAPGNDEKKSLS